MTATGRSTAVIFDVDGTLADSVRLFISMSAQLLDELGAPPVPEDHIRALMSEATPDLLLRILPEDFPDAASRVEAAVAQNMEGWLRRYHEETQPLPGAIEVVNQLGDVGHLMGLATSSGRALPFLDRWRVRGHFAAIVGREDVENHKPDPEPLLLCAERLGTAPELCIYVGDSLVDIRAARAAGMRAAAVSTGTASHDALASEGPDLLGREIRELLPALLDLRRR